MFKRSQTQLPPPTAPTFAQILEDLETFQVEKAFLEQTRTLNSNCSGSVNTSSTESPQNSSTASISSTAAVSNVNEWWKTFETFQSDVQYLKRIRRDFKQATIELEEANADIVNHSDRMKQQIAGALSKVDDSHQTDYDK